MVLSANRDLDHDERLGNSFDNRLRALFSFAIPLHVVAILADALVGGSFIAVLSHLAMAGLGWVTARTSRDAVRTIIFTHVYWTFSFATYAYALAHGQGAGFGLAAPERSALIALTAQAGLFLAFLLSPATPALPPSRAALSADRRALLGRLQPPLFLLGLVGIASQFLGLLPNALAYMLTLSLYLALAIRIAARRGNLPGDPLLVAAFSVLLALSVLTNDRTDLLAIVLLLAVAALMAQKRLLTLANALLAYLAWRLLSLFSTIAISIRWARDQSLPLGELFAERFFTLDTLWLMLNPLHVHAAEVLAPRAGFGANGDLFARLTLLPQMDVAISRLSPFPDIRWGDLWETLLAALPSLGQAKHLIFSDVLAWELGLRARETVGRPMITAEGELFAMGGYLAVFIVIPPCFLALHLLYRALARLSGSRAVAILMLSQLCIGTMLSTTLLSTVVGTIRTPLQLLALLAILLLLAARLRRPRLVGPVGLVR